MFALIRHAGYQMVSGSLTSDGISAAKALVEHLHRNGIRWEGICSSPSKRTLETAAVIGQELSLTIDIDERVGMEGNIVELLPPDEPRYKIIVSHLPILTKLLRAWSRKLQQDEPPLTEMGHGYLIDPDHGTHSSLDLRSSTRSLSQTFQLVHLPQRSPHPLV